MQGRNVRLRWEATYLRSQHEGRMETQPLLHSEARGQGWLSPTLLAGDTEGGTRPEPTACPLPAAGHSAILGLTDGPCLTPPLPL